MEVELPARLHLGRRHHSSNVTSASEWVKTPNKPKTKTRIKNVSRFLQRSHVFVAPPGALNLVSQTRKKREDV